MASKHDQTAARIARSEGVSYNRSQGPDVNTGRRAIEVETSHTVRNGLRQLQGFRKPVYIAGADADATEAALRVTDGTTVGVMNPQGRIVRSSSRGR